MYFIETINPVAIYFFSDTDLILDSSPDSTENFKTSSAPPVSEVNSKLIPTGSTVQTVNSSEKFLSSSEIVISSIILVQRPPLSSELVAPAITPVTITRPIHSPGRSNKDPPLIPLRPPANTDIVARKTEPFKHRKSVEATSSDKPTSSSLQNKIDKLSTSATVLDLKTASDSSSETFSLLYPKVISVFHSTSSVDGFLSCESEDSTNNLLWSSFRTVAHSYNLGWRPIQTSSSSHIRWTSSSFSAILRQHSESHSSIWKNLPSPLSDMPFSLRPFSDNENSFTVQSNSKSTHLIGDQETFSSLSATNTTDIPYYSLHDNCRPTTPNSYLYPLRFIN